ncbi:hypothetical protein SB775_07065 [Peribacillus sp. SIMBA_075]|uniref:hypothetical protein n=1 Tax=Peribacillus sp. SIMBA_075 TaxID=3085813 RepID=UPI0039790683
MRSEQRKSKLTLYIILSLALIIAISSFIYAAKSKHQLTEQTTQLEYAASNNEEASNERISELETELESLSQQLDEAESKQPQTESKSSTESKETEPAKEVTQSEPKQSAQTEYDGIHISHDPVFNGTTASFFLFDNKPSDAGYHYKGIDAEGGLFIPHSEASKYELAEMGDSVIDVTFDQEGNIVSLKKNDNF